MAKKSTINQAKYDSVNCKNYHLKLVYKTDKDIIEKLSSVPSMQGYIKQLIRDDIRKENREEEYTMAVKEIAKTWIDNADVCPVPKIDLKTSAQYVSWMDPDTDLPEELTPESFMAAWNDIVNNGVNS